MTETQILPDVDDDILSGEFEVIKKPLNQAQLDALEKGRNTQAENREKRKQGFQPGQSGNPAGPPAKRARRVNVTEKVRELGVDPIRVMCLLIDGGEAALEELNLRPSEKITPKVKFDCAKELLTYMAPKLRSVEVKQTDPNKAAQSVVFLPASGRELESQAIITLPSKDGENVSLPITPDLAQELIDTPELDDE